MNQIDRLKEQLEKERIKSKCLEKKIREIKREILSKMKNLEEEIKDLMYMGDRK